MKIVKAFVRVLSFSLLIGAPLASRAQAAYPDRPVKLAVAIPAGGSVDMVARVVGQQLAAELGQPFVVENRAGGFGFIGMSYAAKAPADGYTLVVAPAGFMATNKSIFKTLPYDPEKDFAPISKLVNQSMVLVVRRDSRFQSVAQLVAGAKSAPGTTKFASAGDGSPHHLSAVLFESRADVRLMHVPYKGGAPAMVDLLAGTVDILFAGLPEALPYIAGGKLKPLALLAEKRSSLAPNVPTMAEAGLGDLTLSAWMALFAPANTPAPVVEKLNRAVHKVLAGEAGAKLRAAGLEPSASTPQELKALVTSDIQRHAELARAAGVIPQ